jgi:hypothetical protein
MALVCEFCGFTVMGGGGKQIGRDLDLEGNSICKET